LVDIPESKLGPDEVSVRIEAAAINPSDVGNVNGKFAITTLPRVVGRDFAGTVIDGPDEMRGLPVWGSGGDIGFTRDGSHAEYLHIPIAAATRRPKNLSVEEAASVGVPFVTAWSALELAQVKKGEWVIVSGAAGAVGGAATELCSARGARVIALVRNEEESYRLNRKSVHAVAYSSPDTLEGVVREATEGKGR
jgi:NADPH:quinone reductase